jgi:hypothetical protein
MENIFDIRLQLFEFGEDFLTEKVVAHGHEAEAEEKVGKVNEEFGLVPFKGPVYTRPRHKVPESNFTEADDTEVDGIQVLPSLPLRKHDGPYTNVTDEDVERGRARDHDHFLLIPTYPVVGGTKLVRRRLTGPPFKSNVPISPQVPSVSMKNNNQALACTLSLSLRHVEEI